MVSRRRKRSRSGSEGERLPPRKSRAPGSGCVVADSGLPGWLRTALTLLAGLYLLGVFANVAVSQIWNTWVPLLPRYFTQIACLFPNAATHAIEYRLEVWDCERREFSELDFRPLFPLHADDKENRFQRTAHFYKQNRQVMRALERYVVEQQRVREPSRKLGGIRLLSLRLPLPAPGEPVARWQSEPLSSYPEERRRLWYYTPNSRRRVFCSGETPPDDFPPPSRTGGQAAPATESSRELELTGGPE
jgi:hypothetical protein